MNKLALTAVLLTFGACKWTEFDDEEAETWVHSTTKPNSDSSDYGVALVAGGAATSDPSGDRLVVLGAGQALYSELNYTPDGSADFVGTNEVKLNNEFGISTFDTQPILLHDPKTDEVSIVVNSSGTSIAILSGVHMLMQRQIFNPVNSSPDAAAYVTAPTTPTAGTLLVVAAKEGVYGTPATPSAIPSVCRLLDTDNSTAVPVVAIGGAIGIANPAVDDIIVWSATGKLYRYPAGVAVADPIECPMASPPPNPPVPGTATPVAGYTVVDTGFVPAKFSQMHILDGRYAILVGHMSDTATTSQIMMYDLAANGGLKPTLIGTPVSHPAQRSSAILTVDPSHRYVAAGYPDDTIDGTATGQVILYAIDNTTGIATNPAETLNDAQPDANEQFGRALTTFTFNGHEILAVGADNEVFAYYRTQLYGDTRAQ